MAMVLDALASYVQNKLTEMVEEELHMLLGVPNEINSMETKLRDIKNFLADADRRNIIDGSVREWVQEFRGAMYNAADILDLCQLKVMEQGPRRDIGCFNSLLFCIGDPLHAHKIGSHLKTLNEKIDDIGRRSRTFNFIELTSYEDHRRKKESSWLPSRETTAGLDKLGTVGEKIEEDTRNLVELLMGEEKSISEHNKILVFAIVGVGGIGKTTLAKNVINNEIIQKEFEKRIWLSVNQNFNELDLLKRAITAAGADHTAAGNIRDALERILEETLKGNKTLLVMDDVWDYNAWEHVLKSPLTNILARGSRVLVTTRLDIVARGMMAKEPYHHVEKLEPEDAWSLLKKQVVKDENDESRIDMLLKDIGMKIVAKCDGLPLAVKAMGGLLRQKKIRRSDWENVLNDSIWSISQMPEDLNNAIYLSYEDLPSSLKPCFLHFSLLPRSTTFYCNEIVGMWISEGFVHGGSCDLEELGRKYYDELILRNLIEPDVYVVDQDVCSMHDIVRSFAQYVARDEALSAYSSNTDTIDKLSLQKFIRRIAVETKGSKSEQLQWTSLQTQTSLRTLILVGPTKINAGSSLVTFSSLRTLYVQGTNFDAMAESLVQLKHLRFLSIRETDTSILPENIGDTMKFLQYINVYGCKNLVKMPTSIIKLQHLRYLNLCDSSVNMVPKGFSCLANLRKLYGFPVHIDGDWCSLEELGPLSKLTNLYICGLENLSSSLYAKKSRLSGEIRLRFLSLKCTRKHGDDGSPAEQQQIEVVFDELCPPPCLEHLRINGYFGQRLPSWMTTATMVSLGNLRYLHMSNLPYCTEVPSTLCQLPFLESLRIISAPCLKRVGTKLLPPYNHEHLIALENSCSPVEVEVIDCPELDRIVNIPKTILLTIAACPNLKVMEGMSALQRLVLGGYMMTTLPGYLQDVNPKQLLTIYCDVSLLTAIAMGKSGPEWGKFCHIRQVKAYAVNRKWYVVYTRDPFSFKTNISRTDITHARRRRVQHLWLAYETTCPVEAETTAGLACADKRQPLCQRFRCNAYRHLVWWLQEACLHCCEADDNAVSSDQWTEAAAVCGARGRVTSTPQQFARREQCLISYLCNTYGSGPCPEEHKQNLKNALRKKMKEVLTRPLRIMGRYAGKAHYWRTR